MAKQQSKIAWIGKGDEADALLGAATNYIERRGGKVIIVGPIELQQWPKDRRCVYRLAVRFIGKRPIKVKRILT